MNKGAQRTNGQASSVNVFEVQERHMYIRDTVERAEERRRMMSTINEILASLLIIKVC